MKGLKHWLLAIAVCLSATIEARTAIFADEDLHYEIVYHWGIVWKHAASATLSIRANGDSYHAALAARTVSWADKVFKVRDTLRCTMQRPTLRPLRYEKAAHEGKSHSLDIVQYAYEGNTVKAHCTRRKKGKDTRTTDLETTGEAYDMLSVFYYLRTLDFNDMDAGSTYTTTVFSGRKKETLSIKYAGIEDIKLRDKSKHKAHHVKFSFTQDGQTKSSDDMDTWISTDASHIPLMMRGKLPIGEVRCYFKK